MKHFISFSKFDKKYFMLIIIACIVGIYFGYWETFLYFLEDKQKHVENYVENKLLLSFLKYLGYSYFFIGEVIRKRLNFKGKVDKPKDLLTKKDFIFIGLISIAVLIAEFLAIVIRLINGKNYIYIDEYYNIIEFAFLFTSSLFIFKMKYYKHQYISVILILILEIIRFIVKFNEYFKFDNIILVYLLQMIRAFIDSILIGYSKGLMDKKFFSPYKVTYIFGLINLILISIIYIIITYMPVENNSPLCFIEYKNKCYIDNIFSNFVGYSVKQIILLFFHSIFVGLGRFLLNFILNYFTICHLFVYYNFCEFFINCQNEHPKKTFLIISNIVEFFVAFIFFEIIELNCFGLSKDIKENIEKRALLETEDCLSLRESLPTDDKEEYIIDNQNVEEDSSLSVSNEIANNKYTINK